jgi:hypothetical protein
VTRARLILAAAVIAGAVDSASGQTQTADGVAAIARGDYQRAAEILKPLAEDLRSSDTAAQFFMAGLYETGRGVAPDPLRACALYSRAVSKHEHPFGQAAVPLFFTSSRRGGQEFDEECQLLANIGFEHGFEPATFHLGPGHSIELTLTRTIVTYGGRTREHRTGFAMPGMRFLPAQHTELLTGPTRSVTRHFIEQFIWLPSKGWGGPWQLHWGLSEVVRDEIVGIHSADSLVTVEGDAPPSRDTFDVRAYAAVRVDDDGNAEWAVLKGAGQTTQRIETDTERLERREEQLARDKALKQVDWDKRSDVHRQPSMTYIDAGGCGHIQVYAWTADRAEALVVRVAGPALDQWTTPATFDLSRAPADVSVEAHVYDSPRRQFHFCSDVVMPRAPGSSGPETWRAVAGTLTIELSPPGIRAHDPHLRRATITLANLTLRSAAGTTVRAPGPVRLTTIVGAMFGL